MTNENIIEQLISSGNFEYYDDSLIVETVTPSEIHVFNTEYLEHISEETSPNEFRKRCLDFMLDDANNNEQDTLENENDIRSRSNYFKDLVATLELIDEVLNI